MAFKMVTTLCIVALCHAGLVPVIKQSQAINSFSDHQYQEEQHAPANYEFEYSVHDEHTGDIKSQHEVRQGDNVKGYYSLVEPDGHTRTVEYTSDAHSGFNANVKLEGHKHQTGHQEQIQQIQHAAPVKIAYQSSPVTLVHHQEAPVAIAQHSAPIYHGLTLAHHQTPVHEYTKEASHSGHLTVSAPSHQIQGQIATSHSSITHHAQPLAHHYQ